MPEVITLDLNFQSRSKLIAAYLIKHDRGGVLIETGPGSTVGALTRGLAAHGLSPEAITDVFVTHIHLDHAGASGWLARHGSRIHVHPIGAPHLENPERLMASARRIYQADMDRLWGEMLPVPAHLIQRMVDGDQVEFDGFGITAFDTPGHASHHLAYVIGDTCFSGDVGGVRMPGLEYLVLPMPPPDLDLELWRNSLATLRTLQIQKIAPTHFGLFSDVSRHLDKIEAGLDETETWLQANLQDDPDQAILEGRIMEWMQSRALENGVGEGVLESYEIANPSWMAAAGLSRYWNRIHNTRNGET